MNYNSTLNMQLLGLLYSPMRRRRIVPVTTSTTRMMRLSSFAYITTIVLLVTFNFSFSQVHASAVKGGRCPEPRMDTRLCGGQVDQCTSDDDCSGESLCCTTGCSRVCILPSYTACEQVKNAAERRARTLTPEDAKFVQVPECEPETGKFKPVQCNGGGCYCVDSQGFELPGTRAKSLDAVNCTNPRNCDGPMCRMLCPHGFELDEQGCEMCECKNVCKGVKCPSETTCEVEEAPCSTEPCPPVPSCKQPRSLDSFCPFGAPLIIPESGNPFLCGNGAGQPTCPTAFECNVQTGNEYGVCCATNRNFDKPGSCPVVATTQDSSIVDATANDDCTSSCRHDLDCPEFDKCCITQGCGKQCTRPANSTACRQQKHIAELMSQKELEGKGYIPQCDENGNFIPKQCSRNGKVCWCVGPDGKNYPQSIGPSESVNCTNTQQRQRAALRSDDSYGCDKVICMNTCEFGFKTDRTGCPTCDCVESPCDTFFECPTGSKCQMVSDPSCLKDNCTPKPTCLSDNLFVNPCALGTPLTDMESGQVVACSESATTCPSTHICVIVSPNKAGLCCANRPRVEPTKPGMCPLLSSALCNTNTTLGLSPKKCFSDNDCENSMKCCGAGDCTVCADPLLQQDMSQSTTSNPTMCQYLRDAEEKVGGVFNKFRLAISKPQCKDNGEFNEIQCDESNCMCVDENGVEIPGTMMEKTHHNLTSHDCIEARSNPKCLEMNCRLACDYGYETLDGCRICECRNPCMSKNGCGEDEQCEMVDIDCSDGQCPPLPFCIPKVVAPSGKELSFSCPKGTAFVTESNETLTCNPRARMLQCPDDYFCHDVIQSNHELGFCCPVLSEDEASQFLMSEDRKGSPSEDIGGLLEGIFGNNAVKTKIGQCPYLIPFSSGSCESECESDYHCPSSKKCCLNSCGGSQCTEPLLLTACQHQKSILEHKAREDGIPAKRVFIPDCDEMGEYVRIQSFGKFRWCVDSAGHEIQGTRVSVSETPNCQKPAQCPQTTCSLQCEFGLQLDSKGCSICQCKPSPCDDVNCDRTGEECRMMQLNCISEPCPPVPLCLPKLDNPCAFASPLTFEETGDRVPCGPGFGSCPSSHRCNLSPFGEYAVCCPKPKEVCFEKRDPGNCKAVAGITKWFFNSSSNECQPFFYSGCGGNSNLFNSKAECLSVCPALTHCERMREKNLELVNKYKHLSYIPKCDPRRGEWESVQCFEEVGMCWCVNKKGEPIKGTMTNGIPNCQTRRGRLLGASSTVTPTVCEPGVSVHVCNKTLCDNKVCLGHPTAKCMINPCGGCSVKWISSEDGQVLDCNSGLSKCHKEMQSVMNSRSWINQGYSSSSPADSEEKDELEEYAEVSSSGPTLGNAISQLILNADSMSRFSGSEESPSSSPVSSRMSTKVTPIFADFGGHRVMGIMSSTVTIMGGGDQSGLSSSSSSEEEEPSNEDNSPVNKRVTPVKSIADILADMMTSQSQHTPGSRSGRTYNSFDDFVDLMPSSSQMYPIPMRGLVPPPPVIPEYAFSRSDRHVSRVRRDASTVSSSEEMMIPDSMAIESSTFQHVVPPPNREILVSIIPRRKSGNCPKPSHFALFNLLTGACSDECRYDSECNSHLKCCLSKCGMKCVEPESLDVTVMEVIPAEDVSSSVLTHSYEEVESPTMLVSLPQCDSETGDYTPVQSQGDLSWCVTPDGQPILETFTRGKVSCSSNGTILERFIRGPVCPDSEQTPMICQDQCMQASCSLHPEAICVMDVCNDCRPSFYSPSGEKVRCEEKCQQLPANPGLCRASILRYSYNPESNKCEEFIYGGCQGNDNNFESLKECQSECEKTEMDVCSLPMKPGPCRASMPRWYFNKDTQSCEEFDYGGCGGNENNFMSKEHCETRCPDLILCPNIVDGEMKSCSRLAACKNISCPNQPLEDFICSVDACSCTAVLKDFNGNEVRCEDFDDSTTRDFGHSSDLMSKVIEAEKKDSSSSPTIMSEETSSSSSQSPFEVLRVHTDNLGLRSTKCLSMSNQGVPISCDTLGQFSPLQCIPSEGLDTRTCFCVDEAGNQPDGSEPFTEGSKSCQKVTIEKVEVTLSFPVSMSGWDDKGVQLGTEVQDLLRSFNSRLEEGKVESGVVPGSTIVRFTLIGDNKVDIAYFLETMVKASAIGVEDQGRVIAADYSTSRFTYVMGTTTPSDSSQIELDETTPSVEMNEVSVDEEKTKDDDDDDAVSAESLAVEDDQSTLAVLLTLVAAISAGLVVFGMFLAFQKKKSTGCYPKKPFETLAFNSQLYEFEKKVPKGSPTFTATPYVNQYKVTEEKPSSKA